MGEYRISVIVKGEGGAEISKMETATKGVTREVGRLDDKLKMVFSRMESVGKKMMLAGTGIVGGLGALAVVGAKSRDELEKAEAKLKTFLKTDEKVKAAMTWAEAKEFKTPFDETEIMNAMAVMENYQLKYTDWFDTLANASAGLAKPGENPADRLESLSIAMGKIAAGDPMGMRLLKSAGINLKKAGLDFEEGTTGWAKMVSSPTETLAKLRSYMDTEFAGSMERMANTGERTFFRFKDVVKDSLRDAVTPAMTEATKKLKLFIQYIQTPIGKAKMEAAIKSLSDVFMTAVKGGEAFFTKVWPKLEALLEWFGKLDPKIKLAIPAILLLGGAGMTAAGKIGMLVFWIKQLGIFGPAAAKGIGGVGGAAAGAIGPVLAAAAALAQMYGVYKLFTSVLPSVQEKLYGEAPGTRWRGKETLTKPIEGALAWASGEMSYKEASEAYGTKAGYEKRFGPAFGTPEWAAKYQKPAGGEMWKPLAVPDVPGGAGGGGGGGGGGEGGGGSGGRGAVTIYQTIERLIMNGGEIKDAASLMNVLGKVATSEVPASG